VKLESELENTMLHLRGVLAGTEQSEAAEKYKKGGKERLRLKWDLSTGGFSETEFDMIIELLQQRFPKCDLHYITDVLWQEAALKILMKRNESMSKWRAERILKAAELSSADKQELRKYKSDQNLLYTIAEYQKMLDLSQPSSPLLECEKKGPRSPLSSQETISPFSSQDEAANSTNKSAPYNKPHVNPTNNHANHTTNNKKQNTHKQADVLTYMKSNGPVKEVKSPYFRRTRSDTNTDNNSNKEKENGQHNKSNENSNNITQFRNVITRPSTRPRVTTDNNLNTKSNNQSRTVSSSILFQPPNNTNSEPKTETYSKNNANTNPQNVPDPNNNPKANSNNSKTYNIDAKIDTKTESNDIKPATKTDTKTDAKTDAKIDAKTNDKTDDKTDNKTDEDEKTDKKPYISLSEVNFNKNHIAQTGGIWIAKKHKMG